MMKDNLKNKNGESYGIIRFNSVKSKIYKNKKQTLCNFFFFFFFCLAYIKKKYY